MRRDAYTVWRVRAGTVEGKQIVEPRRVIGREMTERKVNYACTKIIAKPK